MLLRAEPRVILPELLRDRLPLVKHTFFNLLLKIAAFLNPKAECSVELCFVNSVQTGAIKISLTSPREHRVTANTVHRNLAEKKTQSRKLLLLFHVLIESVLQSGVSVTRQHLAYF